MYSNDCDLVRKTIFVENLANLIYFFFNASHCDDRGAVQINLLPTPNDSLVGSGTRLYRFPRKHYGVPLAFVLRSSTGRSVST